MPLCISLDKNIQEQVWLCAGRTRVEQSHICEGFDLHMLHYPKHSMNWRVERCKQLGRNGSISNN